jgi:hypothetical protein
MNITVISRLPALSMGILFLGILFFIQASPLIANGTNSDGACITPANCVPTVSSGGGDTSTGFASGTTPPLNENKGKDQCGTSLNGFASPCGSFYENSTNE